MINRIIQVLGFALFGLALIGVGFFGDSISLKTVAYIVLGLLGILFLVIPYEWAIFSLFFYLGIEGFAKLMTRYNPFVHVGSDILITLLWFRTALTWILLPRQSSFHFPPLAPLIGIHWIWFLITILNPYSLGLVASLAGIKLYGTIVSLFFYGYYLSKDIKTVRFFMVPWVIVCILQVITALYQASVGPSSVTSLSPMYAIALQKFEGYAFRPFGLASQPGQPGVFIYLAMPFVFYFFFHARWALISLSMICLMPGAALTLLVCQVRSALLKAIIGAAAYSGLTLKWMFTSSLKTSRLALPFFFISIAVILLGTPHFMHSIETSYSDNKRAFERTLTLFDVKNVSKAREGAWERFKLYASTAPFGAGLSRTGAASAKFQEQIKASQYFSSTFFTDNLWVELVVDLGIPGFLILTAILIYLFIWGVLGFSRIKDMEVKSLHGAVFSALFAILIGCYGAEPILYNPEGPFFWFFAGVMIRLPELQFMGEKG